LREEPLDQGDRGGIRSAALPDRHDRDLLRPAREAGGRLRPRLPHARVDGAAVVWFDEIEAGINAQAKEGELGRIFGFFLTWMQEKTRGLFVGATANRIDLLPAEMIRKGRFDEVFFVDLPLDDERIEIFKVHLRRREVDASGFNFEPLKKLTRGWTGAEIEQSVVSALTTARLQDRDLTVEDLYNATGNVVPLSKTMKEQVDLIRNWAFDRAVRASPREGAR
jgi:SpoVK/Ycf46/Vps4 family AAA+-type ATPase